MKLLAGWAAAALLQFAPAAALLGGDEIDKLVQRRLSPGVVALFARQSGDARVLARLKEALSDRSAQVRTVASRVLAVANLQGLLPELKNALATETDADAAREQIRVLCTIGGTAADPEALTAVQRFNGRLDGAYVRVVGRLRGLASLPVYFSSLSSLSLSASDRRGFFRHVANRNGLESLGAAGSYALSRRSADDWQALLAVAAERGALLQEGVLATALRDESPRLRAEAAWYMAKTYRKTPPASSKEILEAADQGPRADADPEARFGLEMLRRVLGRPAVEDEGWIACLETNLECHLDSDLAQSPLIDLLTDRERMAMLRRNGADRTPEAMRWSVPASKGTPATAPPTPASQTEDWNLRLATGLPRGIASDLISVGGCSSDLRNRWYNVATIKYGAHGLPVHVTLAASPSKLECRAVAETIFLLSSESEDAIPGEKPVFYVALFDAGCLSCNEEPAVPPAGAGPDTGTIRVRAKVVAPKLDKKIDPLYPEDSRKNHQEGVNVYEAVIGPTGCVRELHLSRGSYPVLDIAGMEAIARWRYKPATLDGRPVQVYLTVTVTYRLGR